jgi:hypothetical protein
MLKAKNLFGLLFIGIGLLFLLNMVLDREIFSIEKLWPIFIFLLGVFFELNYFFTRINPRILIPGGILTIIGTLFFFEVFSNWRYMELTWPVFILAVAIGLLQFYFFSGKPKEILIPASILSAVGLVFLVVLNLSIFKEKIISSFIIAIVFVVTGIVLLLKNRPIPF